MTINFHNTHFEISASKMNECPGASVPEIVFAGRSNAGKSTAINTLCKQRQLAYASKMPGRTQLLNFFHVLEQGEAIARLVDLPGYGFAQLAQSSQSAWDRELGSYLADRISLRGCVLIVDARRGLLELDHALIQWVSHRQLPVHILLSKSDKFNRQEQVLALRAANKALEPHRVNGHVITVQLWSALKKQGVDEFERQLTQWIRPVDAAAEHTPKGTTP
ncbi:ribosome biogenesis GTP-binding protein YihA/YsxC [Limnobacter humi]|uniref:Probable GTP-binding protein EngB n=1 Tax=Limnobacter humi TaxID=1778671 RepID=A0ABT1WCS6_9BURK|nr:ribosome biogenesis GTP-binding protein YihA/YsxC [Limnobacter humi]MCQ8895322.1 ribosome biogenesis GTP-binding protein YihA/YsxC [Limnobacter humi]